MTLRLLKRGLAAIGAGLMTALILASPSQASHPTPVSQAFYADSGDDCLMGYSRGTIDWTTNSPVVGVSGTVVDAIDSPCDWFRDDGYATTVTFTAYTGPIFDEEILVGRESFTVDNAALDFRFRFDFGSAGDGIVGTHDRIEIVVCRDPVVTDPISYCGKTVVYTPPIVH